MLFSSGLSSNVVVLDDLNGTVITAPSEMVLTGTVLKLLLAVCAEEKIPVRRECPLLKDLAKYSVLITSTSRLALPVKMVFMTDGQAVQIETKAGLMQHLVEQVRLRIEAESVQVI
jgi:branched-subunit amino acid aminotransferase/4-amino-4-deoxychorismate lyase